MAGRRRKRGGRWGSRRHGGRDWRDNQGADEYDPGGSRGGGYGGGYGEGQGQGQGQDYESRGYGRGRYHNRGRRENRWDRWNRGGAPEHGGDGADHRYGHRQNYRRGWDERERLPTQAEEPYIALHNVEKVEPIASLRGVSQVARSHAGFLAAYKLHSGDPYAMGRDGFTGRLWAERRRNFIHRNEEAAKIRGEPWWRNGEPTRRHLALIMWAYTPTPQRTALWLKTLRFR